MTTDARLFLQGYARPLSDWTERALTQTFGEIAAALRVETRPAAKRLLEGQLSVLDAETDRRRGALSPQRLEDLVKQGAMSPSFAANRRQIAAVREPKNASPQRMLENARERHPNTELERHDGDRARD
jgi:hypothetical protein